MGQEESRPQTSAHWSFDYHFQADRNRHRMDSPSSQYINRTCLYENISKKIWTFPMAGNKCKSFFLVCC